MRVYTAGPLGFSEGGVLFHERIVSTLEQSGYEVLDPWEFDRSRIDALLAMPYGAARRDAWSKLNMEIGERNGRLIDSADVVFAVLDGTDVDSGTVAEIGYAYARGKKILGYRGDFRLSADNEGSIVNLQVEYFIRASSGKIIRNIADLTGSLAELAI